jgi:hypothetical protein
MSDARFAHLPGGQILEEGVRDLEQAWPSLAAILVAMAWPRLEPLSIVTRARVDEVRTEGEDLEVTAYNMLVREFGREAHARFLALSEELDSGISALEREARLSRA